jgi:hypothetical protein
MVRIRHAVAIWTEILPSHAMDEWIHLGNGTARIPFNRIVDEVERDDILVNMCFVHQTNTDAVFTSKVAH